MMDELLVIRETLSRLEQGREEAYAAWQTSKADHDRLYYDLAIKRVTMCRITYETKMREAIESGAFPAVRP